MYSVFKNVFCPFFPHLQPRPPVWPCYAGWLRTQISTNCQQIIWQSAQNSDKVGPPTLLSTSYSLKSCRKTELS